MRRMWKRMAGVVVGVLMPVLVALAPMALVPAMMNGEAMARPVSETDVEPGMEGPVTPSNPSQGNPSQGSTSVETSILPGEWATADNGDGIKKVLGLVLNILVYGIGVLATLGVIIAGIMYMTARDSEQQIAKAKKRLIEIVIGLAAWALMYGVLNWLIPGGWSGLVS